MEWQLESARRKAADNPCPPCLDCGYPEHIVVECYPGRIYALCPLCAEIGGVYSP